MYCTDQFPTSAQHPVYYFRTSCSPLHTCAPPVPMCRSELSASTMQLATGAILSASRCQRSTLPPLLLSHHTLHNLRLFRTRAEASRGECVPTAAYWSVCTPVFMVCLLTSKTTSKQTMVIKQYMHAEEDFWSALCISYNTARRDVVGL